MTAGSPLVGEDYRLVTMKKDKKVGRIEREEMEMERLMIKMGDNNSTLPGS